MSKASRRERRAAADAPSSARPAAPASPWLFPLVAAAVAVLVYAPSIAGDFVYDDGELILRNPSIRDLTASFVQATSKSPRAARSCKERNVSRNSRSNAASFVNQRFSPASVQKVTTEAASPEEGWSMEAT